MKKTWMLLSVCLSITASPLSSMINPKIVITAEAKKTYVYYVPHSSYAYHSSKNCWTLRRSKTIKKTTIKKAKKQLDLKPCGVCYR